MTIDLEQVNIQAWQQTHEQERNLHDGALQIVVLCEVEVDGGSKRVLEGFLDILETPRDHALPRLLKGPDKRLLRGVRNVVWELARDRPENTMSDTSEKDLDTARYVRSSASLDVVQVHRLGGSKEVI